jgi:hypothetical protein
MYSGVLRLTSILRFNDETSEKLAVGLDRCRDYRSLVEKRWRDLIHMRLPASV